MTRDLNIWKTVRVFISSTFRDMHAERDHLVKTVFPRLRAWCEAHRIHFVDIDLRWGITQEEAENGKVLSICESEIDGCRPFFLCLLGGQYGWIDTARDPGQAYSITHLEILHAAFREGQPIENELFFYHRDPGALLAADTLPVSEAQRRAYSQTFFAPPGAADPSGAQMKLDTLKREIAETFGPQDRVRSYAPQWNAAAQDPNTPDFPGRLEGLEAFGAEVERDLIAAIKRRFADHIAAASQPLSPLAQILSAQEDFIETRTRFHVANPEVQQQITAYLSGDSPTPCLLTGAAGSGKSATLAHWIAQHTELGAQGRETAAGDMVVFRAIGAGAGTGALGDLLSGLWLEIRTRAAAHADLPAPPAAPNDLAMGWPAFLQEAAAALPHRLILCLDGLDHLHRTGQRPTWLPFHCPSGLRLLLSLADDRPSSLPQALRRRALAEITLPPLNTKRATAIVRGLPSIFGKSLDADQIALMLRTPAARNPLFLTTALGELRIFGSFEQLGAAIAALPADPDPQIASEALFTRILRDLMMGQDRTTADVTRTALGALVLCPDGLSEGALQALLTHAHPGAAPAQITDAAQHLLRRLRPWLMRRTVADVPQISFFHRVVTQAVTRLLLNTPAARIALRAEVIAYLGATPWFDAGGAPNALKSHNLMPLLTAQAGEDAAALPALHDTLLEWDQIDCAYRLGRLPALFDTFRDAGALEGWPPGQARMQSLVLDALRNDVDFVEAARDDYPQALLQSIWNRCWWYDHPNAAAHYEGAAASGTAPLSDWAERCRQAAATRDPDALWLRSLRPPPRRLSTGIQMSFSDFARPPKAVHWSPDGALVFVLGDKPALRVLEAATGVERLRIDKFAGAVSSLAATPDGTGFAVGLASAVSRDSILRYTLDGLQTSALNCHRSGVHQLAFTPDGSHLVAASSDSTLSVWNMASGEMVNRIGTEKPHNAATALSCRFALLPDSTRLLRYTQTRTPLEIWPLTGDSPDSTVPETEAVSQFSLSPDGTALAVVTQQSRRDGRIHSDSQIDILTLADNSRRTLLVTDALGEMLLWCRADLLMACHLKNRALVSLDPTQESPDPVPLETQVRTITYHPGTDALAVATGNPNFRIKGETTSANAVTLWDAARPPTARVLRAHAKPVSALEITPDGGTLVSFSKLPAAEYAQEEDPVRLWHLPDLHLTGTRQVRESIGRVQTDAATGLAYTVGNDHGADMATVSTLRIWDWPQMRSLRTLTGPQWTTFALWPGLAQLMTMRSSKADATAVQIRSLTGDALLGTRAAYPRAVSPCGSWGVYHAKGALEVRDMARDTTRARLPCSGKYPVVAFTPQGDRIVYTDALDIVVCTWPNAEEIARWSGVKQNIDRMQVSSDGAHLVMQSARAVRVVHLQTHDVVAQITGRLDAHDLDFDPKGTTRWAIAGDSALSIIEPTTGTEHARVQGSWHPVRATADGARIMAAQHTHIAGWELVRMDTAPPASTAPLGRVEVIAEPDGYPSGTMPEDDIITPPLAPRGLGARLKTLWRKD